MGVQDRKAAHTNMNKGSKDKGKQPVLDRSKANDMNMAVLKRIDPQLEEVRTRQKV